uniref:SLAM family member 7-like n=1 Tax=Podarcis muralis TaxID=64176 RepID=UPI0010A03A59|nr:SLAM family member 7-like [Podarcis muralis]
MSKDRLKLAKAVPHSPSGNSLHCCEVLLHICNCFSSLQRFCRTPKGWRSPNVEALSHAVGNPTHQLKGMLGGSILFPANVSQGITVQKMEWDFRPQRRDLGYWLGEFSHWNRDHPSPTGRFGQRLDRVNETTLRLKDLELDDGGIYNTRIWFTKTQFQEHRFKLTVYEPVPTPHIDHQVESKTPGGCNVTLRCHTPGREDLSISWEAGNPHRALGKSVTQYQVSHNGRELRVSFWNSSFDSNFTCLVSNPIDQNRASFDLHNICQSDEGGQFGPLSWSTSLITALIVLQWIMVMWTLMYWKRRKGRNRRGIHGSPSEDGDDEVDSDFPSSSKLPRESFPSLSSYAVSETEPSEIPHCIPQNIRDISWSHCQGIH